MKRVAVFVVPAILVAACHGHRDVGPSPAAIALVHADLRVVEGETTWVTRGPGYELVGRSKADLAELEPHLAREAAAFRRVFPADSIVPVIATIRREAPHGKPYVTAAPTPTDEKGFVVELVLPDSKAPRGSRNLVEPVVRAWLSARASALTKQPARSVQAKGEVDDPRVPAWAEDAIPSLSEDSIVDRATMELADHQSQIIPLAEFLTMPRPAPPAPIAERREGESRGGSGGAPSGGMGRGRGGMRGGRGGMGRGGSGNPGGERRASTSLPMFAIFAAQSAAFGRYLSRESYALVGSLTDAQILGQPIDSVLARQKELSLPQMDANWKEWLTSRAATIGR